MPVIGPVTGREYNEANAATAGDIAIVQLQLRAECASNGCG